MQYGLSLEKSVGILGGEPTLHPEFKKAVTLILDKGFDIVIKK
jgi:organic radical activating enzyme